jgi:hypothetical protein
VEIVKLIIPCAIGKFEDQMSNLFEYSISLLVVLMAVSFMIASAQEGNNTAYNNTLKNISSNLSAMNDTAPSKANIEKIDPMTKVIIISSDNVADPANSIGFDNSDNASKVTPFIICGFTRPTRDAIYENQSSLNAAILSRIVEGTPHGYATYY